MSGELPPGTPVEFDDQLPAQQRLPDGTFKDTRRPQLFVPDSPTPNGMGGTVLTTKQVHALVAKVIA